MGLFNWFGSNKTNDYNEKTRRRKQTTAVTDYTNSMRVNEGLTKGIYYNTYPGLKLAGFGFNIVNVPVSFMGLPVVTCEDNDDATERLQALIVNNVRTTRSIHTQCHRDGTLWIYPEYTATGLRWKQIPDQNVSRVVLDMDTDEVIQINTEEEILISVQNSEDVKTVTRRVVYTADRVVTTYPSGGGVSSVVINTAGCLPIAFANNADDNEVRGHSEYERLLADLKAYHDVDLAKTTVLSKFTTKQIQTVSDYGDWLENNGLESDGSNIDTLDIASQDLIVNQSGETTEFIMPSDAVAGFSSDLKMRFHKLVELSGIPEIAWGLKTEGNLASVEENMAILMQYCKDKQEQKIKPYTTLMQASARLLAQANEMPSVENDAITVSWNALDSTSESTKAATMKAYAEALASLVNVAAITPEQLHAFYRDAFPGITDEDFDRFSDGLQKMVAHTVSVKATPTELLDAQGLTE